MKHPVLDIRFRTCAKLHVCYSPRASCRSNRQGKQQPHDWCWSFRYYLPIPPKCGVSLEREHRKTQDEADVSVRIGLAVRPWNALSHRLDTSLYPSVNQNW
jgi:hypothetical protein